MEKPSTIVTTLADEISTGNLETDKKIKNLKKVFIHHSFLNYNLNTKEYEYSRN